MMCDLNKYGVWINKAFEEVATGVAREVAFVASGEPPVSVHMGMVHYRNGRRRRRPNPTPRAFYRGRRRTASPGQRRKPTIGV
jgi:hypothetical protein